MFSIDDAPVLPLHPHCHCSFCIPREGNDAEITASGQDLTSVYMDAKASGPKGRTDGERSEGLAAGNPSPALWRGDGATSVKGYERIPKSSGKKITFSMSEIRSAPDISTALILQNRANSAIMRLEDRQVLSSLGARSISGEIKVFDPESGNDYYLVNGSSIRQIVVFAGKGTKNEYRKAWKYAEMHGGDIEDWQHVKGRGKLDTEEGPRLAAIHWSECEGIGQFDFFVKKWLDE